jgi:ATP-binding cassette subfamily B protein RaxB
VAPSGYGKSTLIKLIAGLLSPIEGRVFVGGTELNDSTRGAVRPYIATVMQDDTLFSGSILDNICFGSDQPDFQKAMQKATLANIHDDIMKLPMQYETPIGDMGSTLSGGQIQRILIARALYKEPQLLLMDEATSHLDKASEAKVNAAIKSLNITRVIVAHRIDTIEMCDQVIDLVALTEEK